MTRAPLISPWTPEQDDRLKVLAAQGASAIRAAAALKRPVSSVRARARKLGVSLLGLRALRAKSRALEEAETRAGERRP